MVALVPFWLLALTVVWVPFRVFAGVAWWTVPAFWLALGLLLFVPLAQVALLAPLLGVRRATPYEASIVSPLWEEVARSAGFAPGKYRVRIVDSSELNAFAVGGRLVVLTSFAVYELSPDEITGVLAHEVSHHMGLHTVALTIGHWLSVPVLMSARVGFWLRNVATAATQSFAQESRFFTVVGSLVAYLLFGVSWLFLSSLYASDYLANLVGKRSEFEADLRAVRLGYGRELQSALRAVLRYGGGQRAVGWRERLSTSHPPARTRAARIDALMRAGQP